MDKQPEGTSTLERNYAGVNIYYTYSGTVDCFDLDDDPHGMGGWDWQVLKLQLFFYLLDSYDACYITLNVVYDICFVLGYNRLVLRW